MTCPQPLHYSSVVSVSAADVQTLKSLLVKAIDDAKNIIRDSAEQELHSFSLDFFNLK